MTEIQVYCHLAKKICSIMYMEGCPTPSQGFKEQKAFLCLENYLVTIPKHPTPRYILKIFDSIHNNVLK